MLETTVENSEVAILSRVFDAQNGDLSAEAARSWIRLQLPEADRERLIELSEKNKVGSLSSEEENLLENYLHVGRLIDLMKSKARLSLKRLGQ